MHAYTTTVPGYPRVGHHRVYKAWLEKFWSGAIPPEEFKTRIDDLRAERLRTQAEAGLDLVPVGDFSLYDHVLDTALMFGAVPARFDWHGGEINHELYFAIARGRDGVPPVEMTKWFDTNYHYLVPELPERFQLTENRPLTAYRAAEVVGKPVLLGPFTFLKLARLSEAELALRLEELLPLYEQVLSELAQAGASLIQVDEPSLVGDLSEEEVLAFQSAYQRLGEGGLPIILQTYYGDVAPYWTRIANLPVAGFGLDFVRGRSGNLAALHEAGFPAGRILVAGVVDGRNIWRTDLDDAYALVKQIEALASPERLILSASCTLLHLPETLAAENALPDEIRNGLSFAQERLTELRLLKTALNEGIEAVTTEWREAHAAFTAWRSDARRLVPAVQARAAALTEADTERLPYAERRPLQQKRLNLPLLPTTTIGSFPQTPALRKARAARKADEAAYQAAIRSEIAQVMELQEELGLDVLVHGEPERNDMVQFFGDQMRGFATTMEGWVQSYGSRCVRPPIIYGDIERAGPMTVDEVAYAQSLTEKPVKGMLTGPITILQWSFVREDVTRAQVADQIALAIRDELSDLENAGIGIVQIDEAAYREGLPLRRADWPDYIAWAVRAFRVASSGAKPETQVHTHMCYSEFGDMIEAIAAMDADVISIEDARSDGALLRVLRDFSYPQAIGPGVYDIHSPNVPTVEFIKDRLEAILTVLTVAQVWVNPDCGLKTRKYPEVTPSLKNMVDAAKAVRATLG